jgi:hypothetical protein
MCWALSIDFLSPTEQLDRANILLDGQSGELDPRHWVNFVPHVWSAISKSNDTAAWTLEYDQHDPQKFRLWNKAANCYLATSYRSFPDWDGVKGNDTILQGLGLELEITCLRSVKLAASTREIVDGRYLFLFRLVNSTDPNK